MRPATAKDKERTRTPAGFANFPSGRQLPGVETPQEIPQETPVWTGRPSQWVNAATFAWTGVLGAGFLFGAGLWGRWLLALGALVPALWAGWVWLTVRSIRIDVTSERISVRTGVLSRRRSDLELYRVRDTTLVEPFLQRLVSLADIHVISSDRSSPLVVIPAIREAESLRQQIRHHVERLRLLKQVREVDFQE